jgi:predicted lactoylglutathione lyase
LATQIFVNLPVKDLDRSKAFFAKLGYSFNPKFTDATAACMAISDDIYAMLLTEAKFKEFTTKPIANAKEATEVLICLSLESKAKVNEVVDTALSAGAIEARPVMDYGFMFGRSFHDPDGHIWEIIWMDPKAATEG